MRDRATLGMAMFLISDGVLFFFLLLAFVYFRPAVGISLDPRAAAVYTACLLASAFTVWRAGREEPSRLWLSATALLGTVFLAGQVSGYLRLFRAGINMSQGLFGTTFFTLAGVHGLHIAAGLVVIGILAAGATRQFTAIRATALYWYFLTVVWLCIFGMVYLWSPR
jgi:heme/copper-type cytochrome/quinol oxidase subunit 3